jgi:hypothetical protein
VNLNISVNGSSIGSQSALNLISGTGVIQTCSNNTGNSRVDCTPSLNAAVAMTNENAEGSLNAAAALTAHTTGMWLLLVTDTANTAAQPTLNVDNVGLKTITQSNGSTPPNPGQIAAGAPGQQARAGTSRWLQRPLSTER